MNNEIHIRTCKGDYLPGEVLYGAVYLRISCPTEANGIRLSFKGIEICSYEFNGTDGNKILRNEAPHVDIHQAELYSQKECFQFGCYVFPFCLELPQDAPGSIKYKGSGSHGAWSVDITYTLTAYATGATSIQASQQVVVCQAGKQALAERLFGCAQDASFQLSRLPLFNTKIHITAKLVDNFGETGNNLQLRLVVTNQTKVKVTSFNIKLLRYFRLFMRGNSLKGKLPALDNMEMVGEVCHIAPEGGPKVVHSVTGATGMLGNSAGLDRIQIPLCEKIGSLQEHIPPSVSGRHISNRYGLEVALSFSNGHIETLTLPIPGILPKKNRQWSEWKAPDWIHNVETKLSSSNFSVPRHLLRTEALGNLPGFQVL